MPNYDVIEDYNSYHGIKTTYGAPGMPKPECKTCNQHWECSKLAPWVKLCEPQSNVKVISREEAEKIWPKNTGD